MDLRTGRDCAVKRLFQTADERVWKESFYREQKALEDLKHPNIVELIDCGRTPDGALYLVLEWIDHNLEEWIAREGPMSWPTFWHSIGRPLLDAIKTAQAAKWVHRDIKPRNILMTTAGIPKISDYGIARDFSKIVSGYTLREFTSEPYSPPEKDDGSEYSYARDVFSWAVLAGFCLTGREPTDYGEIASWLGSCNDAPFDILQRAASLSKEHRPRYAALLLQEIEDWCSSRESPSIPKCFVRLTPSVVDQVRRLLDVDGAQATELLRSDFAEVQGARPDPEAPTLLRLYGATWMLVVQRDQNLPGLLEGIRARYLGSAEAERQRDAGFPGPITLNFSTPEPDPSLAHSVDALFAEAVASEKERELRWKSDPDRVFRAWHAYLSARYEFESSKASAFRYSDAKINGRTVSVTATDPIPSDILGQDRMVRFGHGKFVAVEVQRASGDELTLSVVAGDAERFPRQGLLERNTLRAEKALDRQRQALNAVMHRRSVNPALRDLIVDPAKARSIGNAIKADDPGEKFDADKRVILGKALNFLDVMTVEGPPGTGKTRLIEEIVIQYLEHFPKDRVLISSQTHVALDNVIERLIQRASSLDIVRVGRYDDARISSIAAELLLERKADEWSMAVREKAQQWLANWAAEQGVNPTEVRAGLLSLRLSRLLSESAELALWKADLKDRGAQIQQAAQESVDEVETDTLSSDTIAFEVEEIETRSAQIEDQLTDVRDQLAKLGGLAAELASADGAEDLEAFGGLLVGDSEAHRHCRNLIELQEAWLDRVGRSTDFHAAMLSSANVVAATCIGLAGVRGIENVAFDLCIVDESSKATATELLVPLSRSRRAILVGDPNQLPPFFEQGVLEFGNINDFREDEIRNSVFDRFLSSLPAASREELRHQHRMVAPIGALISGVFYDGKLINEKLKPDVQFPSFSKPITWLDTSEFKDRSERSVGTSFANNLEARAIRNALRSIAFVASKRKNKSYSVAVVAGYQAQVIEIENAIVDLRAGWSNLEVAVNTVDAFQGSEADICIYSVVRSNSRGKVGFLREAARLNVALSRGRDLLVIVGDHAFCSGLGPELPMSDVVKYGFENPQDYEVRVADVS
jgi:serine/threonine protein kinase